jgi:hypothetical protein
LPLTQSTTRGQCGSREAGVDFQSAEFPLDRVGSSGSLLFLRSDRQDCPNRKRTFLAIFNLQIALALGSEVVPTRDDVFEGESPRYVRGDKTAASREFGFGLWLASFLVTCGKACVLFTPEFNTDVGKRLSAVRGKDRSADGLQDKFLRRKLGAREGDQDCCKDAEKWENAIHEFAQCYIKRRFRVTSGSLARRMRVFRLRASLTRPSATLSRWGNNILR